MHRNIIIHVDFIRNIFSYSTKNDCILFDHLCYNCFTVSELEALALCPGKMYSNFHIIRIKNLHILLIEVS